MDLQLYGPVGITFQDQGKGSAKLIDASHKKKFLQDIYALDLSSKQGCYIFALRAAKGYCPWYVGKATKSMHQECMAPASLNHYNAVLFKGNKGSPVMFFISPEGGKNKVPKDVCDDIETFLIQSAYYENPNIRNIQKTKVPEWSIKGIIRTGKGKPTDIEQAFKKMMGLE